MWDGGPGKVDEPIVQVVQVKQLASAPGTDVKFRVVFSDIVNYIQSMLVTGQSQSQSQSHHLPPNHPLTMHLHRIRPQSFGHF